MLVIGPHRVVAYLWYTVGGGVLDAPQVCVVDRFNIGARLCWFVGRGLDPSLQICGYVNLPGRIWNPPLRLWKGAQQ